MKYRSFSASSSSPLCAAMHLDGSKIATATDKDGQYSINVPDSSSMKLSAFYSGMVPQTKRIGASATVVDFKLKLRPEPEPEPTFDDKRYFSEAMNIVKSDSRIEADMSFLGDYSSANYEAMTVNHSASASYGSTRGWRKGANRRGRNKAQKDEPNSPETERYSQFDDNHFTKTEAQPLSSFSIDADGASYSNARRIINDGYAMPNSAVRVEEFLNYFTFDLPEPQGSETISANYELSTTPWDKGSYLLRFGLKGKTLNHRELPPANHVFLVDVSGSMSSSDKLDLLKEGLIMLANNLQPEDRVSIVTYSGEVKIALESTRAKQKDQIIRAIEQLNASGYTNGGDALKKAYKIAKAHYIKGGNNRIILCTDGDFNFGITSNKEIIDLVKKELNSGIYLTTLGFGTGNLNETMMEQMANNGNGTFEYIDGVEQLKKVFVNELSKLYCVAKDAKIQVKFNDKYVAKYRLVGYENRTMTTEEFDDEDKDAGEIGSGQTITALYEIIPTKNCDMNFNNDSMAEITVRYKDANNNQNHEIKKSVKTNYTQAVEQGMSQDQSFASAVAMFALILRESEYKGNATPKLILEVVGKNQSFDEYGYRREFVELVKKYQRKK